MDFKVFGCEEIENKTNLLVSKGNFVYFIAFLQIKQNFIFCHRVYSVSLFSFFLIIANQQNKKSNMSKI